MPTRSPGNALFFTIVDYGKEYPKPTELIIGLEIKLIANSAHGTNDLGEIGVFLDNLARLLYTEMHLANNKSFRIVGVHLKNKGIFNTQEWAA